MRKKIALVNQRYGLEVNGGSELHCRQLAEKLIDIYDVEVITTCALDYITWDNYYPEGLSEINGITVRRFKTDKSRDMKAFDSLSGKVFSAEKNDRDVESWLDEQGPYSPECVEYLRAHYADYDVVIFMTYLYYITARCLGEGGIPNAFLLPTAHDEPPIYIPYYKRVFKNAKGIIYNTTEERTFCEKMFGIGSTPNIIAGVGVDVPDESTLFDAKARYGLDDYIIYIGRIDESKGCGTLFKYFEEYKKRVGGDVKLVLVGKSVMDIPKRDDIIPLGFVTDEEKFSLIRDAKLLVLASEFESLSMVVLESMVYGRPVLVNGKCMVLKGHCHRSNAGLYFENYFEFEGALKYLLTHDAECERMGENGKRYVNENYRWDVIVERIKGLIDSYNG
ncbi:MAG: glycosyltransferase family 4 protein [Clostridia bacterium]|nr:glycosyltransferase family 4 protein [Clostridia bacterium]